MHKSKLPNHHYTGGMTETEQCSGCLKTYDTWDMVEYFAAPIYMEDTDTYFIPDEEHICESCYNDLTHMIGA